MTEYTEIFASRGESYARMAVSSLHHMRSARSKVSASKVFSSFHSFPVKYIDIQSLASLLSATAMNFLFLVTLTPLGGINLGLLMWATGLYSTNDQTVALSCKSEKVMICRESGAHICPTSPRTPSSILQAQPSFFDSTTSGLRQRTLIRFFLLMTAIMKLSSGDHSIEVIYSWYTYFSIMLSLSALKIYYRLALNDIRKVRDSWRLRRSCLNWRSTHGS